jgi:tetratricopeptide (TPR) repeat protein
LAGALTTGTAIYFFSAFLLQRPVDSTAERSQASSIKSEQNEKHEAVILAEALKKKPDHTPVLFRLAQISQESGNYPEAARHLKEILRHEPDNTDALLELGKVLFELGDVPGAIEQTQKILERRPSHADALYNLGAIYANLGNSKSARDYWGRLIASSPQSESAGRARTMLGKLPPKSL